MSAGAWGWPPLTRRCVAVLRRNFLVWRKTALTTVLGDVLDPVVALLALGFGLGALLPGIEGVPYVTFLSAGSMCVGALYGATFEATYNAFSRLHVQRTWDAMLSTPLDLDDVVWAEILWAAAKALKSGIAILLVVVALDIARAPTLLWVPPVLALAGLAFASMALVVSALARGYEFFMYYFTLGVTPMVFPVGVLPRLAIAGRAGRPAAVAARGPGGQPDPAAHAGAGAARLVGRRGATGRDGRAGHLAGGGADAAPAAALNGARMTGAARTSNMFRGPAWAVLRYSRRTSWSRMRC